MSDEAFKQEIEALKTKIVAREARDAAPKTCNNCGDVKTGADFEKGHNQCRECVRLKARKRYNAKQQSKRLLALAALPGLMATIRAEKGIT